MILQPFKKRREKVPPLENNKRKIQKLCQIQPIQQNFQKTQFNEHRFNLLLDLYEHTPVSKVEKKRRISLDHTFQYCVGQLEIVDDTDDEENKIIEIKRKKIWKALASSDMYLYGETEDTDDENERVYQQNKLRQAQILSQQQQFQIQIEQEQQNSTEKSNDQLKIFLNKKEKVQSMAIPSTSSPVKKFPKLSYNYGNKLGSMKDISSLGQAKGGLSIKLEPGCGKTTPRNSSRYNQAPPEHELNQHNKYQQRNAIVYPSIHNLSITSFQEDFISPIKLSRKKGKNQKKSEEEEEQQQKLRRKSCFCSYCGQPGYFEQKYIDFHSLITMKPQFFKQYFTHQKLISALSSQHQLKEELQKDIWKIYIPKNMVSQSYLDQKYQILEKLSSQSIVWILDFLIQNKNQIGKFASNVQSKNKKGSSPNVKLMTYDTSKSIISQNMYKASLISLLKDKMSNPGTPRASEKIKTEKNLLLQQKQNSSYYSQFSLQSSGNLNETQSPQQEQETSKPQPSFMRKTKKQTILLDLFNQKKSVNKQQNYEQDEVAEDSQNSEQILEMYGLQPNSQENEFEDKSDSGKSQKYNQAYQQQQQQQLQQHKKKSSFVPQSKQEQTQNRNSFKPSSFQIRQGSIGASPSNTLINLQPIMSHQSDLSESRSQNSREIPNRWTNKNYDYNIEDEEEEEEEEENSQNQQQEDDQLQMESNSNQSNSKGASQNSLKMHKNTRNNNLEINPNHLSHQKLSFKQLNDQYNNESGANNSSDIRQNNSFKNLFQGRGNSETQLQDPQFKRNQSPAHKKTTFVMGSNLKVFNSLRNSPQKSQLENSPYQRSNLKKYTYQYMLSQNNTVKDVPRNSPFATSKVTPVTTPKKGLTTSKFFERTNSVLTVDSQQSGSNSNNNINITASLEEVKPDAGNTIKIQPQPVMECSNVKKLRKQVNKLDAAQAKPTNQNSTNSQNILPQNIAVLNQNQNAFSSFQVNNSRTPIKIQDQKDSKFKFENKKLSNQEIESLIPKTKYLQQLFKNSKEGVKIVQKQKQLLYEHQQHQQNNNNNNNSNSKLKLDNREQKTIQMFSTYNNISIPSMPDREDCPQQIYYGTENMVNHSAQQILSHIKQSVLSSTTTVNHTKSFYEDFPRINSNSNSPIKNKRRVNVPQLQLYSSQQGTPRNMMKKCNYAQPLSSRYATSKLSFLDEDEQQAHLKKSKPSSIHVARDLNEGSKVQPLAKLFKQTNKLGHQRQISQPNPLKLDSMARGNFTDRCVNYGPNKLKKKNTKQLSSALNSPLLTKDSGQNCVFNFQDSSPSQKLALTKHIFMQTQNKVNFSPRNKMDSILQ